MSEHNTLRANLANAQDTRATETRRAAVKYVLYTEDKANLTHMVGQYFTGASFVHATGLWHGELENARIITIFGLGADRQRVLSLARWIREVNKQSCVYVESLVVELVSLT